MPEPTLVNSDQLALKANSADLGTAASADTGTTEGKIPLIGAGDKLAAALLPSLSLTDFIPVADQAERLGLTSADTYGKLVKQADNGRSYGLPNGNDASQSGDWVELGDALIETADVVGLDAALADEAAARIAADALKLTSAVSVLENPQCLARLHDKIQILDQKTNGVTMAITGFGDSRASLAYEPGYIFDDLIKTHGLGGICSPGFGNNFNSASYLWTLGGGATQASTDYTYGPGSNLVTVPVGGTASLLFPGAAALVRRGSTARDEGKNNPDTNYVDLPKGIAKVVIFAIKESGGGTLNASLVQTGYSDVTGNLDTNAADGCGTITLLPNNRAGAMTLSLSSTTATTKIFGAIFYTDRGIVWVNSNVGGSTMDQQKVCLSGGAFKAAYSELLAALNCGLVFHSQRVPGDAGWQANYPSFFAAYESLALSQIVLGEPALVSENSPTTTVINDFLRTECAARGIGFFDPNKVMTPAIMAALGWDTGDVAHNLNDCNRYVASRFLDAVGRFRTAFGAFGGGGLSRNDLASERFRIFALHSMRSTTISPRGGSTPETAVTSGGGTFPAATNERGYRALSAAALSGAMARTGVLLSGTNTIAMNSNDLVITGNGYRNLNIPTGVRAFLVFGGSTTNITTLTGLTQKCFGLEWAKGSDVGSPDGETNEVVRMFSYDGTTRISSAWAPCKKGGEGATSLGGFGFVWRWDVSLKTHFLFHAQNSPSLITGAWLRMSLYDPAMFTAATTAGVWVHQGIIAEDGGNVPVATGELGFLNITAAWDNLPTALTY